VGNDATIHELAEYQKKKKLGNRSAVVLLTVGGPEPPE
jgi:hypothetical protein